MKPKKPKTFADLPFELRTKIFRTIARQPRTLLMHPTPSRLKKKHTDKNEINGYVSAQVPVTLHINQESRKETKKYFHLISKFYLNANTDILTLSCEMSGLIREIDILSIPSEKMKNSVVYSDWSSISDCYLIQEVPRSTKVPKMYGDV